MGDCEKAKEIMINYYSPKPEYFEVWYDDTDEMYHSIAKFKDCDAEIIVSTWDDDFDCQEEIFINDALYAKIKNIMEAI